MVIEFCAERAFTKTTPSLAEWIVAMQEPEHLAAIISAKVLDAGKIRDIFLQIQPMGSYYFSMGVDRVILAIEGRQYPVHSVQTSRLSRMIPPSFYKPQPAQDTSFHLRDVYRDAAEYVERVPEFSLQQLVESYKGPAFKASIESFMVLDNLHRYVSVVGLPQDSYRVSLFEQTMFLNIWGKNLEVEAVTHKNGITLLPANGTLEAYESVAFPAPLTEPI